MPVARRKTLRTVALLAALAALASCSGLPTTPTRSAVAPTSEGLIGTISSEDGSAQPTSTSLATSKPINGRLGGIVTVGRWKLVVPAGAFVGTGVLSISVPDTTVDQCNLSIAPLSLNHFLEPVELRFLCGSMQEADLRDMRWWNPATKTWVIIQSWPNSEDVSRCAPLAHFSTYASGGKAGW